MSRTSVSLPETNVNGSDQLLRITVEIFMGGIYELNIKNSHNRGSGQIQRSFKERFCLSLLWEMTNDRFNKEEQVKYSV